MNTPSLSAAWQAVVKPFKWFVRVLIVTPIAFVYNGLGKVINKVLGKQ